MTKDRKPKTISKMASQSSQGDYRDPFFYRPERWRSLELKTENYLESLLSCFVVSVTTWMTDNSQLPGGTK
jgi:hypothetical protein